MLGPAGRRARDRPDVSVIGTAHDVADARTHRTVFALHEAGLTVEVFGRGQAAQGPTGATVRIVSISGLVGRGLAALRIPFLAQGRLLLAIDPDPLFAATVRRLLRGSPIVADCQEDYAALLCDRPWAAGWKGAAARGVASLGVWLAARADLTTVADDHVPPLLARQRLVVRNLPFGGYLPSPSPPDRIPRAVYIGDVRRSRGLLTMLDTLALAPSWELDIVGSVSPAEQGWVDEWLASSAATDRVRFHGRLPPEQAWQFASGAWVGLCLLDPTPAFVEAMPSKVYEYLAAGLPVLVTELPRAAAAVSQARAGHVVTDAVAAARALDGYVADPALLDRERRAAVAWAEKAASADPYRELARHVQALLAGPAPTPIWKRWRGDDHA